MSLASRKLIQATAGATTVDTGDDDFANVVLLLDGDGTSGDNNETFTDSSANGYTVTESGSVVQGSFSPYGNNWSNSFDGNSDALTIPDSTDFDFGTGDFTMEAWVYPTDVSDPNNYPSIVSAHEGTDNTSWIFAVTSTNKLMLYGGGGNIDTSTSDVPLNEWTHVMVTRSSGTVRFFINGTLDASSYTRTGNYNATASGIAIGKQPADNGGAGATRYWQGWISNVRLIKGTALHTSSFTPSTTPLTAVTNTVLLACQSNRFVDNSSSSHTLTPTGTVAVTPFSPFKDSDARDITTDGGSGYFGGDGGYLQAPTGYLAGVTTGDFTIEGWWYFNDFSIHTTYFQRLWSFGTGLADDVTLNVFTDGDLALRFNDTIKIQTNVSGGLLNLGEWNHIAVVRVSGTAYIYVNGTSAVSGSFTDNINTKVADPIYIGSEAGGGGGYLSGYCSDVRVLDSALYSTGNPFTPPTSPLTAITDTNLLLNFQDAGIYDRSGINNLDTVGDAKLGFAPIYGTGSLAFDGTGDYLGIENTPELRFSSSSPFTIELWVNANALSGDQHFFWAYDPSSPYTGWALAFGANSQAATTLMWWDGTSWTNIKTGMEANRWYHIAVCSEGSASTGRFFVDGVQQGSAYTIPSTILNTTTNIRLGSQNNAFYFNGYFDDVRITNGVARYTSNFTPPDEIDLSTDTHREYVTFFLDGDGTVNGQNNTFTDSSTNGFTVTESGSVVQGVFSPYGDNWSNYFDGSTGLQKTSGVTTIGTGDFTVEFWFYPNNVSSGYRTFYDGREASPYSDGVGIFQNGTSIEVWGNGQKINQTGVVTANQWTHLALVRSSGSIQLYINGSASGSSVSLTDNFTSDKRTFGENVIGSGYTFQGYISNLRETRSAVYTSGFTPSTTPLSNITNTNILMLQSNRTVDNSSNNYEFSIIGTSTPKISRFSPFESDKPYDITTDGGSAYFDLDDTAYLSFSGGEPSVADMTISGWVYPKTMAPQAGNAYPRVFAAGGFLIYVRDDDIRIYNSGEKVQAPINNNEWTYFAAQRSSNTWTLYINGVSKGTASDSANIALNSTNYIGSNGASNYFTGYIADLRITTSGSTSTAVPTSPVSAVTNTELLLNFQDSAIPDLSGINNIDTVGNAKVAGTDPTKYGSNAMQFDGSGDYLSSTESITPMGTGAFTWECWCYITTSGSYQCLIDTRNSPSSGSSTGMALLINTGTYTPIAATTTTILTSSINVTQNSWTHVALTRSAGGTLTLWVNGQSGGSISNSTNLTDSALWIGGNNTSPYPAYLNGYLDDLRITKGVARYTANFTPPTDALPKF